MHGVHAECRLPVLISLDTSACATDSIRHFAVHAAEHVQPETPAASATIKAPWAALVVDDDAGVRQSLRLCLEAAGARVLGVATGGAALEALDRGHFDVVFLDLWLGTEAGSICCRRCSRGNPISASSS